MKKIVYSAILCTTFLFLLLHPQKAVDAASYGLTLWYGTLVPTLFPVMILSNLLIQTNLAALLTLPVQKPLYRILGISPHGTYAILCGFLCGFPMGAKVLSDLYLQKLISKDEAAYLAVFCNNVSPAFVINYLISQHMPYAEQTLPILLIIYGSPLLYGLFSNYRYQKNHALCSISINKASFTAPNFAMIDACIMNGIQSITKLGGYITLFSVLTAMIDISFHSTNTLQAFLTAALEITTGIDKIASLNLPVHSACLLLTVFTVFGGMCSAAQSQSMLETIGIKLNQYLKSRLAITAIACIMALCYLT